MTNNMKAERTLTAEELRAAQDKLWYLVNSTTQSPLSYAVVGQWAEQILNAARSQSLSTQQPMGEVTDEMVERGARKLAEMDLGWGDPPGVVNATVDVRWMEYAATSRAALTAALHPNQESGE